MRLTTAEHTILDAVHRQITDNFIDRVSIKALCLHYSISLTKLTQGFRFKYGLTIYSYQLKLKMAYAKKRIEEGSSVFQLAEELRYSNTSSFIRAFKKVYDRPPGIFRYGVD